MSRARSRHKRGAEKSHDEKSPPDAVCCETCFFFDLGSDECRQTVPVAVPTHDGKNLATEWPSPSEEEWCGEWHHTVTFDGLGKYLALHGVNNVEIGGDESTGNGDDDDRE